MAEIELIYHDDEIIVVIKPGGMLAVPGRGPAKQDCVSSRLQRLFPGIIAQPAVHRLDMYTSGLMVFARTTSAHRSLSEQFAKRQVEKQYQAILERDIDKDYGEIRLPFRLDPDNRPRQIYDPVNGKMGITRWRRLGGDGDTSSIEFTPLTGRTHQLRVHAAHELGLNTPIKGDSLYGKGIDGDQMYLHATLLCFSHPSTNQKITFRSSPPFQIHSTLP